MIATSNSQVKRSGTPNQFLGVLARTMALSGLFQVRTELVPGLIVPSLAHHPVKDTGCATLADCASVTLRRPLARNETSNYPVR
jgi:hypothetical protein